MKRDGGTTHYGWAILQTDIICEAERHAVWESKTGELIDLKLNPKLVIEEDLNDYLKKRNIFVHQFWMNFMTNPTTGENGNNALAFCYDLEESSGKVESFFKGFIYFLSLRHVEDRDHLGEQIKEWESDFEYFLKSHDDKKIKKT